MTARRRMFTKKELVDAVRLVQETGCGIKFWPDGSMMVLPPRIDTAELPSPPSTLAEWRTRNVSAAQGRSQRSEKVK